MSLPVLRAARPTDAGKAAVAMSEFAEQTPWLPRVHTWAEDIAFLGQMIDRGWVRVVLFENRLAGFMARNAMDIHALYVRRCFQGRGCGRALLQEAQAQVPMLSLWTFQANTAARAFYRKYGFEEKECTNGAGNDENLPDIRFEWHKEHLG